MGPHIGLWVNLRRYFGPRWSEWLMAAVMAGWGLVMLLPADTFALPSYAGFRAIFISEIGIGWFMLMMGTLRIVALAVNGHNHRITYRTRNIAAGVGFCIWIGMFFAHAISGIVAVWIVVYSSWAIIEWVNGGMAAQDIGASRGRPAG